MKNIKTFEEYSGVIYNPENPDKRMDGQTGTNVPDLYHINVTDIKLDRGNNAKEKQEARKKRNKLLAKEYRDAKMANIPGEDDIIKYSPYIKRIDSNAGGAMN